MSNTEKAQIETVHGTVEYETATCASCGQEYKADEMVDAYVGAVTKQTNWGDEREMRFERNSYYEHQFCPQCADDPIQFQYDGSYRDPRETLALGICFGMLFATAVAMVL